MKQVEEVESLWKRLRKRPWETTAALAVLGVVLAAGMWLGGYLTERGRKAGAFTDSDAHGCENRHPDRFVGTWGNENSETDGVTHQILGRIDGFWIHLWGSCGEHQL